MGKVTFLRLLRGLEELKRGGIWFMAPGVGLNVKGGGKELEIHVVVV